MKVEIDGDRPKASSYFIRKKIGILKSDRLRPLLATNFTCNFITTNRYLFIVIFEEDRMMFQLLFYIYIYIYFYIYIYIYIIRLI